MRTRKLLFWFVLPVVILFLIFCGPGCTIDQMDLHIHYHKTNQDMTKLSVGVPSTAEPDDMEVQPYVIPTP